MSPILFLFLALAVRTLTTGYKQQQQYRTEPYVYGSDRWYHWRGRSPVRNRVFASMVETEEVAWCIPSQFYPKWCVLMLRQSTKLTWKFVHRTDTFQLSGV